jgi:hypothetical protein
VCEHKCRYPDGGGVKMDGIVTSILMPDFDIAWRYISCLHYCWKGAVQQGNVHIFTAYVVSITVYDGQHAMQPVFP